MRLLVVGGSGFVGGRLVRHAIGRDAEVAILAPVGRTPPDRRVTVFEGGFERTGEVIERFQPTAIVFAAGRNPSGEGLARAADGDVASSVAINAGGFAAVLVAAAGAGVRRVVQCGSTVVYGPASDYAEERVDEDARPAPRGAYGLTKLMAEEAALWARRSLDLDVTTLRLPLVAGPGRWYAGAAGALAALVEAAARDGEIVRTAPAAPFDLAHGDDAAEALFRLAEVNGAPAVLNLGGFTTSLPEIASALGRLRPRARLKLIPETGPAAFPLVDHRRLVRLLGWTPGRGLDDLLSDLIAEASTEGRAA